MASLDSARASLDDAGTRWTPTRRTLVKGAAWSVPVLAVGAPAAHAGISQCHVAGSLQIGPKTIVPVDAVCRKNSQKPDLNVPRIYTNYGKAYLPDHITICNCIYDDKWYRFRETDTLSNFQIEVDGRHNDQNSQTAGYRPPFHLQPFGAEGACQTFKLTYRTSDPRPYSNSTSPTGPSTSSQYNDVKITILLQRNDTWTDQTNPPPQNHSGWQTLPNGTFVVTGGKVWRTTTSYVNFDNCNSQGAAPRSATPDAQVGGGTGSGD